MIFRSFINAARPCFRPQPTLRSFAVSSFATTSSGPTQSQKLQMSAKQLIETAITGHKVAIFSKSYCPYCAAAKKKVAGLGVPEDQIVIYELDQRADGAEIQSELAKMNGQTTVPNIYISGAHIGGNSDLQKLSDSAVKGMIAQ